MKLISLVAATAILSAAATMAVANVSYADTEHLVSAGETLSDIAVQYDVEESAVIEANGIDDPNLIVQGQTLTIPQGPAASNQEEYSSSENYEVTRGDTLSEIAYKYKISLEVLRLANDLANPNLIFVGQSLVIPIPRLSAANFIKPVSPQIESIIDGLAHAEGVDPNLVKAIALVESGWRQDAVSPVGAMGLMQIMPETAAWLEQDIFGHPLNEDVSAYDNVKAGVRLLRILQTATGNIERTLASYYQGYGNTIAGVLYEDTVDYIELITAVKGSFWP